MNIKVIQRFPDLSSGSTEEADCVSLNDIYEIPFVHRWLQESTYYRLCKTTTDTDKHYLVCETNKGKCFWVIGFIYGDIDDLNLPEWKSL
jgi:hypothetical protein